MSSFYFIDVNTGKTCSVRTQMGLEVSFSRTTYFLACLKYAAATAAKSLQSWPTLCDPTDGSPPGSPVPGILQARTLEWVPEI